MNGRAIQKRWGPLGIMWDSRCVFASDPCKENPQEGPIMLFQVRRKKTQREVLKCRDRGSDATRQITKYNNHPRETT